MSPEYPLLDNLVTIIAIVTPVMTLSQVATVWLDHNVSGISVLAWTAFLCQASFWLIYGIVHKARPIIICNTCWVILDLLIVVGTLVHR